MTLDKLLLLDVGGTFIKCSDGREIPVDSNADALSVAASFSEAVAPFLASLDGGSSRAGIAVAMPGPFDYSAGIFRMTHKYASVFGKNFRELAAIPDCVELRYTHDVNGMLSGELAYGKGRGFNRVAMVTLGTGLGFSMCIDGEILKNELGSPRVSIFKRPFRDGTLEDYASKRAFLRIFAEKGGNAQTVKQIAELAHQGCPEAVATFNEVAQTVAEGIAPILEEYGIECLLFGGQISRSFNLMSDTLHKRLSAVPSLRSISPISDFDNATFNGLRSLFE